MQKETIDDGELIPFFDVTEDKMQHIIKVIGVGGGGCNAVNNMYNEGIEGVTFAACNTDSKQLSKIQVPVKLQLGAGLGAGNKPEVGRSEAESNIEELERLLSDGTKMVFVTAGMGGGTGTGAAPVVAGIAKKMGLLTVGVVTIPFYFEKKRKIIQALKGVNELRKNVDALLIVNNERLCDVYGDSDISVKESFKRADNILGDAVKGISELITVHSDGGIDLDFRDVETTMKDGGGAIMAIGRASGKHRVEKAIKDALDSPLLHGNDISRAKRILFNIYSSDERPIMVPEMQEIDDFFDQLDPNIDVIWGTSTDDTLGEDAKVIILATDMEEPDQQESQRKSNPTADKNDEYYEELIRKLYKPLKIDPKEELKSENGGHTDDNNHGNTTEPEIPFEVETPQEPEPATQPEKDEPSGIQQTRPTTQGWIKWLTDKINDLIHEPEE
jgi:cell division protein FtsZ